MLIAPIESSNPYASDSLPVTHETSGSITVTGVAPVASRKSIISCNLSEDADAAAALPASALVSCVSALPALTVTVVSNITSLITVCSLPYAAIVSSCCPVPYCAVPSIK